MNQDGAIRDAKKLGVPKMLILGLQHRYYFGADSGQQLFL